MDAIPTGGAADGPLSPDAWKRAVYRSAPKQFSIEFLPPEKMGSAYSYGFRVCPIKEDDISTFSGSSDNSNVEYDIWRRWEDCLWFQETLEIEYSRMARDKRKGLAAGKGVKKDGFYVHSDHAASFESLPPGPDPHSIAKDIHDHVPRLTKKGTLFRATQAAADARASELHAMISSMFSDDLPTLVRELRAGRTFTDFFGFWRRDHDLAKKTQAKLGLSEKKPAPVARPRQSISTSPLSTVFSSSSPSLAGSQPTPPMIVKDFTNRRVSTHSNGSSSSDQSIHTTTPPTSSTKSRRSHKSEDMRSMRSRTTSTATTSSSGSGSSGSVPPSPSLRTPRVVAPHDAPLRFGHNPSDLSLPVLDTDRPPLESLPEDRELPMSAKSAITTHDVPETPSIHSTAGRRRAFSAAGDSHRNARIWNPELAAASLAEYRRSAALGGGIPEAGPGAGSDEQQGASGANSRAMARQSVATIASTTSSLAARYLADLGVDFALPSEDGASMYDPRASMCTVDSEAWREGPPTGDAVLPRLLSEAAIEGPQGANSRAQLLALMQAAGLRRSVSNGAPAGRRHTIRPVSVYPEEEEVWDDWAGRGVGEGGDAGEECLDAYFDDSVRPPSPPDSRASTPMGHHRSPSPSPSGETETETETESELGSPKEARYPPYHYPYIPSIPPFSPLSATPITRPRASSMSTMHSSSSGGSTQSSGSGQSHRSRQSTHSMHSVQSTMTSMTTQTTVSNATAVTAQTFMSAMTAQTTQSQLDGATLAIKATHEDTIIMLRIPRSLPYEEVRKRLYDKFVTQEKAPVANTFAVAVLMPSVPNSSSAGGGRERSASVSSAGSAERERARMKFISSSEVWDAAVARSAGKMVLRVIGSQVS